MACESTVSVQHREGVLVVSVSGKMMDESACTELRAVLDGQVAASDEPVVVDLATVRILPSLAIGVLVEMMKKLRAEGRRFIVAGAQPTVRDVLRLTRVDQLLELSDGVEGAVTSTQADQ